MVGQYCPGRGEASQSRALRKRLLEMLKRRPCTLEDIARSVELGRIELVKVLDELVQSGSLQVRVHEGKTYYQAQSSKSK